MRIVETYTKKEIGGFANNELIGTTLYLACALSERETKRARKYLEWCIAELLRRCGTTTPANLQEVVKKIIDEF
jgi:hypothetical protein